MAARAIPGLAEPPQTTAGQYSRTAAEFVPGAILTPGNPLANALRYGVGPGIASEAAGQVTAGTPMEGPARMAAALAGGVGAGSVLTGAKQAATEAIPTAENIEALKNAAYKKAEDLGAAYTPEAYGGLVAKIKQDAQAAGISPDLHPKALSVINNLEAHAAEGEPISLKALDQKRQFVNRDVTSSNDNGERFFGNMIRNNIDQFIANPEPFVKSPAVPTPAQPGPGSPTWNRYLQRLADYSDKTRDLYDLAVEHEIVKNRDEFANPTQTQAKGISDLVDKFKNDPAFTGISSPPERPLPPSGYIQGSALNPEAPAPRPQTAPSAMAAGAAPEAAEAIQNARDLNTRFAKSKDLAEALQLADWQKKRNQVPNIDATTRQNLYRLLKNGNWTPEEASQLENTMGGSMLQQALRGASKFSPTSALPAGLEVGAGLFGNHPVGATALAAGGYAAKKASEAITNRNVENLLQTILAGGRAPPLQVNPQPRQLGAALAGISSRFPQQLPQSQPAY